MAAGWHELKNGELIPRVQEEGFDLFLTNDKNIRYQQNLTNRKIAIVVLTNPQWPQVRLCLHEIAAAIHQSQPGDFLEVEIPFA